MVRRSGVLRKPVVKALQRLLTLRDVHAPTGRRSRCDLVANRIHGCAVAHTVRIGCTFIEIVDNVLKLRALYDWSGQSPRCLCGNTDGFGCGCDFRDFRDFADGDDG